MNDSPHLLPTVPDPQSVTVTSSLGTIVLNGSDITLNCSVLMNSSVKESDLSLLMVDASIIKPDGAVLRLSNPVISGTTFIYTTQVNSFGDSDVGNYTCNVIVSPGSSPTYLTGTSSLSGIIEILIGEKQKQLSFPDTS